MMLITEKVKEALAFYSNENNGVKTNLARILMHGSLKGTAKLLMMPVDQGFEHGPDKSFAVNPAAYDPAYHFESAIQGGCNAYAAPLGMLESVADKFTGQIPLILKLNGAHCLTSSSISPEQTFTSCTKDALRLGCVGVGITIYPGSNKFSDNLKEVKEAIYEAKSNGLAVIIWSYPRGEGISQNCTQSLDNCTYSGYIAATLGANIIKLKLPSDFVEKNDMKKFYENNGIKIDTLEDRVRHVMRAVMGHRRLVVFSGGATKSDNELFDEIKAIAKAGGSGSIIGRNSFQRPFAESVKLLQKICTLYKA